MNFSAIKNIAENVLQWDINPSSVVKALGVITLTLGLFRALRWLVRYWRLYKLYNGCPGEEDFSWLHGNLHKLPVDFEKRAVYEKNLMAKYPKYYRIWMGPAVPRLIVYHPETIKVVMAATEMKNRGFGGGYVQLLPWLGEGLLIAEGRKWSRTRRLLTPAFHYDILRPYTDIYNEAADILLEKIDKYAKAGESFELFDLISLCTFDVILRCAMSYEGEIQTKGKIHPYVEAVRELTQLLAKRVRNPLYFFDTVYNFSAQGRLFKKHCDYVHSFADVLIDKRRKTLEEEGPPKNRHKDFLDILLMARDADGNGLTPQEIRNEVDTFLFEGHDTTASGISWILYSLATHPEYQTRVQKELDEINSGRNEMNIEWKDIPNMSYLTVCVKEAMRLYSPVPFIGRRFPKDVEMDGRVIPAGTSVSIAVWNLHHNPVVWDNSDVYDPDRFLPENVEKRDHYAFLPFSAGSRNCIGQHFALNEEKVIVGRILKRFCLEPDWSHQVKRQAAAVMRAEGGLWMFAKPR